MKPMTSEESRKYWNTFANFYGSNLEAPNLSSGTALCNMLQIENADNILEIGCGSGQLTLYWLQNLPNTGNKKYTSVDLSDEMIKLAEHRKEEAQKAGRLNKIDHRFVQGNAEKLDFIQNESIDLFITPLCFHLVENAENALNEAFRVLKKGGKFGMSVLGPLEENSFFRLFGDRLKELKIEPPGPKSRSPHHLGEKDKLMKLVEASGFKVDFCWSQDTVCRITKDEDTEMVLGIPRIGEIMQGFSEEIQQKIRDGMKEDLRKHQESKTPFKTNEVLLVARKPE